jgi:hypothetical protein
MDIKFLVVMIGFVVGPFVLLAAIFLIWSRRARWFAAAVMAFSFVVAALIMLGLDPVPFSYLSVFVGVMTIAVLALGVVTSLVWAIVVAIDLWERRHAF